MIELILRLIVHELDSYISGLTDVVGPFAVSGNIGLVQALGGVETYMNNKVVVSVVNLLEEAAMKNSSPYRQASLNPEIENPPVFINAFLLFTPNFNLGDAATDSQNYLNSISRLSQVIEFFQGKNLFSLQNSPLEDQLPETWDTDNMPLAGLQEVCISMELVSLTFEQSNYLWGTLGGKQLPSVMYKAHVIPVRRSNVISRGSIIHDIQTTSLHLTESNS
jgi:hypothetical protein